MDTRVKAQQYFKTLKVLKEIQNHNDDNEFGVICLIRL